MHTSFGSAWPALAGALTLTAAPFLFASGPPRGATLPEPGQTALTLGFDLYNQGRGTAAPAHVRAFLSDHEEMSAHTLTCDRNGEIALQLDAGPECVGEGCTPALPPGTAAHYSSTFNVPEGGFGRHVIPAVAGNQAQENDDGTFTLTATETAFSSVAFVYGRHLWIDADSAVDEAGKKLDESGQVIEHLMANDRRRVLVGADAPSFGDLTHLSATFTSVAGGAGDRTPRLDVYLEGHGRISIRLGTSPGFNDGDSGLNQFSGFNVICDDDPGRYDLSGLEDVVLPESPDWQDYSTAATLAGTFTVERIEFVTGPAEAPVREVRLERIEVSTSGDGPCPEAGLGLSAWSVGDSASPGAVLLNDGTSGNPQMQYSLGFPNFSGSWALSTTAANAGTVTLNYSWSGLHSWYQATARLEPFIIRDGGVIFPIGPVVDQSVSGGFTFSGSVTFSVLAGDRLGLKASGSHFDGSYLLQGTLSITVVP